MAKDVVRMTETDAGSARLSPEKGNGQVKKKKKSDSREDHCLRT